MQQVQGYDDALRAQLTHTSARTRHLDTLERYVRGTQYEGRPNWFDDSKPLFERAPCIVYPIAGAAIESHVAMVLGGSRFPRITSGCDEDDSDFDDDHGLSEEQSALLDKFVAVVCKQARLPVVCDEALTAAMSCGTAVLIPCVRNGRLYIERVDAKFCTPEFVPDTECQVKRLEIAFAYIREEKDPHGTLVAKCYMYRRVIDERTDVTYDPAVVSDRANAQMQWKVAKSVKHELGFCPVVWYRFRPKSANLTSPDGEAIHSTMLDEITALNFGMSQRHRAVLYCTDPILVEIGVEQGYNPTGLGVGGPLFAPGYDPVTRQPLPGDDVMAMAPWFRMSRQQTGRARAPGKAYQYPEGAQVHLLTLPADAVNAATDNVESIEQKICETLRWKPVDPKEMRSGATLSGRALDMLMAPQLMYDDKIRSEFGHDCLLKVVDMLLRIVLHTAPNVYIAGVAKIVPLLQMFVRRQQQADASEVDIWIGPPLRLKWGAYNEPNEVDAKAIGDNVRADLQAKLIKRVTAIAKIAPIYGIESSAQYAAELDDADAEHAHTVAEADKVLADAEPDAETDGEDGPESVETPEAPPPQPPVRKGRRGPGLIRGG